MITFHQIDGATFYNYSTYNTSMGSALKKSCTLTYYVSYTNVCLYSCNLLMLFTCYVRIVCTPKNIII